eukprot:gene6187-6902_t
MKNTYFNSSDVISSMPIVEPVTCMRQCTTSALCQSINHYLQDKDNKMYCDLINGNIWSNSSFVQKRNSSTHYFIQSPCSSNPCRNGGTCIPRYQQGDYKCACAHSNHTAWISGHYCETLTVAEDTAKVSYPFDGASHLKDARSNAGHGLTLYGNARVLWVPDRRSPVLYVQETIGSYARSNLYGRDCLAKPSKCLNGMSVSIWFKIRKKSHDALLPDSADCRKKSQVLAQATPSASKQGFRVIFFGCETNAFQVTFRNYVNQHIITWGTASNRTLYTSWSHIVATMKYGDIVILYFNGVEVARSTTFTSVSARTIVDARIGFGHHVTTNIGVFLDDFAAWYNVLSPSDVQRVYNEEIGEKKEGEIAPNKKACFTNARDEEEHAS